LTTKESIVSIVIFLDHPVSRNRTNLKAQRRAKRRGMASGSSLKSGKTRKSII